MHIVYAGGRYSEPVIGVLDWDPTTEHDSMLAIACYGDPDPVNSEHLAPSACIWHVPGTPEQEQLPPCDDPEHPDFVPF